MLRDFDLLEQHRDRVLLALSLTAPVGNEELARVIEPHASPISERMAAMRQAHELGLRVYGMLCPLLPGVAAGAEEIEELVAFVKDCGVEQIFAEAVNSRGPGLKDTADSLREAGVTEAAQAVSRIRKGPEWSAYVAELLRNLQFSLRRQGLLEKLRYLLYPSRCGRPTNRRSAGTMLAWFGYSGSFGNSRRNRPAGGGQLCLLKRVVGNGWFLQSGR